MGKTSTKKPAGKKPTEREMLDQMRVAKVVGPHLRGPQDQPPLPAYWEYEFVVQFLGHDYRFPIMVQESVPENDRDRIAREVFKDTVALIAKKVAAF